MEFSPSFVGGRLTARGGRTQTARNEAVPRCAGFGLNLREKYRMTALAMAFLF